MQRNRNICIWRSIDLVDSDDDSGVEKKFTVTFGSETDADHFQELYSTITLQVLSEVDVLQPCTCTVLQTSTTFCFVFFSFFFSITYLTLFFF